MKIKKIHNKFYAKNGKINSSAITMKDFFEFLNAKTYVEKVKIITRHGKKNLKYIKRSNKIMEKEKKENFFKKAFLDMAEDAKMQHKVDKANFEAVKAQSRANFEENRFKNSLKRAKEQSKKSWDNAHMSIKERKEEINLIRQQQINEADQKIEDAKIQIEKAKVDKK